MLSARPHKRLCGTLRVQVKGAITSRGLNPDRGDPRSSSHLCVFTGKAYGSASEPFNILIHRKERFFVPGPCVNMRWILIQAQSSHLTAHNNQPLSLHMHASALLYRLFWALRWRYLTALHFFCIKLLKFILKKFFLIKVNLIELNELHKSQHTILLLLTV